MSEPNFANRTLFHADNLPVMRGIDSECIDLIATDPPFNKGKDFHATPDSLAAGAKFQDRWRWDDDVEGDWIDQLQDDWPNVWQVVSAARSSWGDDLGAFLCFMAVRLVEMHRILKPTGSIYLHCDPTASHYLKQLLDAIFGRKNFRNEIVWRIGWVSGFKTQKRGWIRNHDILLYYVKTQAATKRFNKEYLPYPEGYVRRDGKKPTGKGIPIEDTWNCHSGDVLDSIMIKSFSKEKTGYPTQKNLDLYERIIKASSNPGEVVLDPFCGCATTPVAAERLGRQWGGVDIWDEAYDQVLQRLQDEGLLAEDAIRHDNRMFTFGDVTYTQEPPERTDDGETAAPFLQVTERYAEPEGPKMTRADMFDHLIKQHGRKCQGCDRVFDDPRYLELDHNTPRADGGWNHISNRVLLCGPCNRLKAHRYTLSGLREQNRKHGYMAPNRMPI